MDDELNLDELQKFWDAKGKIIIIILSLLAFVGAVVCIILGISNWIEGATALGKDAGNIDKMASLGSYLQGSTGSLWALAGFFVVFLAFLIQAIQFYEQRKQFNRQNFESHFFQLLNLHNNIVEDIREKDDERQGRVIFSVLYRKMQIEYEDSFDCPIENDTEELAISSYEAAFDKQPEVLGHYFRNLYHIIKFIDESAMPDKKRYTSIVRAQLSSYEHVLLHYNGISMYGAKKFKQLIEEYALLENMGPGQLLNSKHPTAYSPKAFGDDAKLFVFTDSGTNLAK